MIEIGLAEYFGIGEAIGIIATLFNSVFFQETDAGAICRY
jgi:hypothetical protein